MVLTNQKRIQLLALVCLLVLLASLFIGGHQPASGKLFTAPWDKLAHFIFYGALTVVTGISFPKIKMQLLALLIILIGATDEIHQIFGPNRDSGFDDLVADAIGCLAVLIILKWVRRNFKCFSF